MRERRERRGRRPDLPELGLPSGVVVGLLRLSPLDLLDLLVRVGVVVAVAVAAAVAVVSYWAS